MINYSDTRLDDFSLPNSDPLFYMLRFHKINDLYKLRITKFVFKCLNKDTPENFHNWFTLTSNIHRYNTRSKFTNIETNSTMRTLFTHSVRTSHYGLKLTKVLGSKIWNQLSPSLRVEDLPFSSFYNELKNILLLP